MGKDDEDIVINLNEDDSTKDDYHKPVNDERSSSTRRRVFVQKREYNGSNSSEVADDVSHNGDTSDDTIEVKKKFNPKVVIIAAVGVVLLIVGLVISVSAYQKVKKEEMEKHAEELLQEEEEEEFAYTDTEREELRLAGYTGDEIELFEFEGRDAQEIIDEAKSKRQQQYEEEIKPFFDGASEEFKEVYNNTWYGEDDIVVDPDVESYSYYNRNLNVDYEKLPPKGHQLFIKFYLQNGDAVFMTVSPDRYLELPDEGNMVVAIEYTKLGNGVNIITSTKEVRTD